MAQGLWDVVLQGLKATKDPEQSIAPPEPKGSATSPEETIKDTKASTLIMGYFAQGTL